MLKIVSGPWLEHFVRGRVVEGGPDWEEDGEDNVEDYNQDQDQDEEQDQDTQPQVKQLIEKYLTFLQSCGAARFPAAPAPAPTVKNKTAPAPGEL